MAKLTRDVRRRRAHRRARRHQRHQRHHDRALQRLAARRARRPGPAGAVGRGLAAGVRPRADPGADHQARGHGHRDRPTSPPTSHDAVRDRAAPRTAARCSSTSRSTSCSPRPRPRCPTAVAPVGRGARSRRGRGGPPRSSPRPSARRSSPAATCTGTARGTRCAACVEALRVPVFVNGLGRGCLPADHELAFTPHPRPAQGRGRRGRRRRHAARLPARRSARSATPRSCTSSTHPSAARGHVDAAVRAGRRPRHDPRRAAPTTPATGPTTSRWIDAPRATQRRPRRAADGPTARRRRRPDPAGAHLRRAATAARPRRGRRLRRRRLRVATPASTSTSTSRAAGSTPARTAASAPASGYAIAARVAHPDRQVVLLLGDGAVGFSLHGLRHAGPPRPARRHRRRQQRHLGPREAPDAGDLRLRRRRRPPARLPLRRGGRRPSAARARPSTDPTTSAPRSTGPSPPACPYLVNVLTDPADAYPRSSNLA